VTAGAPSRDLFGHPPGLTYLFTTEMWERFSYYGMRALLVLYMVKYLFEPGRIDSIAGFGALRAALEFVFGPLDPQPLASLVYGSYTALVYFTPIIGGLIADRWLGQRRTVVIGAALMAAGHFMMAFEPMLLAALLLLILGNGAFKPNISTQVGALYAPGDPRRDRAYSVFYVGINLGAFLAPLVCGTLGEEIGWHYGFAAAGVGMTIALVIYLFASRMLPPDLLTVRRASGATHRFGPDEWRAVIALLVLAVPVTLFWGTYEQVGNTIALWANDHTDRSVGVFGAGAHIPTTWFQAFNPFMIFAFTPLVLMHWRRQAGRGQEPATVTKMAYGCFYNAAAHLVLFAAAMQAGPEKSSWLWLACYFVLITIGELYLSPTGLSLVSKVAPAHCLSMLMGVWLATSFTGSFLAGYLGSYWSNMDKGHFFLMIAAIAAAAGLGVVACSRPLQRVLRD
jgi:POT family proton-dependent oligopeptide transporter